jgi:Tol biopolymer transport system component
MNKNISKTVLLISTAFALAIALTSNSFAQSDSGSSVSAWTPELSMQFRRIQGTATSPDGEYIAYVVNTPLMDGSDSEFQTHIWVATKDGSRNTQYTRGDFSASAPAFSPDGEH